MSRALSAALLALHAALIATVVFLAIVVFAEPLGIQGVLYTSDSANALLLAGDILRDPTSYGRWVLPPSFYLVPDVALSALVIASGVKPLWQMPAYYAVMAALQCLAVGLVLARLRAIPVALGMWAWTATLILIVLVGLISAELTVSSQTVLRTPLLFYHSGTLLLSLVAFRLLLGSSDSGSLPPASRFWLSVLIVVATFSDLIFIGWLVAPAVLALVVIACRTRQFAFFRLALLIGALALIAAIAEIVVNAARRSYLHANDIFHPFAVLSEYGRAIAASPDIASLIVIAVLIIAGLQALRIIFAVRTDAVGNAGGLATLFLGTGGPGALAGFIILGLTIDTVDYRFLIPVYVYPSLWLLYVLFGKPFARSLPAVAAAVPALALGILAAFRFEDAPPPMAAHHADLIACLDAEGRTAGLSDYWDAMAVMQPTGGRIHAVAIAADGLGYLWNVNRDWYFWRRDNGADAAFDYVVMRKLDPAKIAARYGTPDREISCADRTIWLYDRPVFPRGSDPRNPS
ncbi:MAG: hypothetical protein H6883_07575 [Rhodobiaceae bacterium]|nr:hypothetical protein [Rhodobiaceae bacterium]MCC0055980.1 hypothetical protein [Rhodobiaceae bacterium]